MDRDEGFTIAQLTMDKVIRDDLKRVIGGDQRRIRKLSTQHSDTTFKHILLPLWIAGFQFRGKTYRFVVNGRSGKVRGERPYSMFKIVLAGIAALAFIVSVLFLMSGSDGFTGSRGGFSVGFGGTINIDWSRPAGSSRWPQVPFQAPLTDQFQRWEENTPRVTC